MDGNNRIQFKFFEKDTTTNLCIQKRSAMQENQKIQSLTNEVIRRLLNTGGGVTNEVRRGILDKYGVKLLTSGYSIEQARRITLAGIRGFERKIERRKKEGKPLYRTAKESGESRRRKKLVGKSSWFRDQKKEGNDRLVGNENKRKPGSINKKGKELKTRTVIFVEFTPEGELSKRIRELMGRLEGILGYKIKVIERTGSKLKDLFPLTNLWGGRKCEREDSVTCNQGERSSLIVPEEIWYMRASV